MITAGLEFSYETCGADDEFLGGEKCREVCTDSQELPRVVLYTHGQSNDLFWLAVRDVALEAASRAGVQLLWFWNDAGDQALRISEHITDRPSEPIITTIDSAAVAAAASDAAAAGILIFCLNSDRSLVAGVDDALVNVAMDDTEAGRRAAVQLLAAGVTRPAFVDHGTLIGQASSSGSWSNARWNGFQEVMSAAGVQPTRLPIGHAGDDWDTPLKVRAAAQEALLYGPLSILANDSTSNASLPRCTYDGFLAAGLMSLIELSHALDLHGCRSDASAPSSSGQSIVGSIDDDDVARRLLNRGKLTFILDQQQGIQAQVTVYLAALAVTPPLEVPPSSRYVDPSILVHSVDELHAIEPLCASLCIVAHLMRGACGHQMCGGANLTVAPLNLSEPAECAPPSENDGAVEPITFCRPRLAGLPAARSHARAPTPQHALLRPAYPHE